MDKIEANEDAISENSANISANSDITDQIVEIENICVNDYFSQSGEYCGEWVGATIERLPLWGLKEPLNDENTFEWPTQEDWATMSPDVRLLSLDVAELSDSWRINSVKVNLTNG